jgi:hypothetical protein
MVCVFARLLSNMAGPTNSQAANMAGTTNS